MEKKQYNTSIQGLRITFAIGVLISHMYVLRTPNVNSLFTQYLQHLSNVSFFFMISGYFCYSQSNANIDFGSFFKKKAFRLYPLHLLILLATVIYGVIRHSFDSSTEGIFSLLCNATLVQTFIPDLKIAMGFNTVSWFISALMICFVVAYFINKLLWKRKYTVWIYALIGVLIIFKTIIAVLHPEDNIGYYLTYVTPLAGLSDFLIGMLISKILKDGKLKIHHPGCLQIISLLMLIVMFATKQYIPINYSRAFYSIPFNILILLAFSTETKASKALLGNRLMVIAGDISFEFYLIHVLVMSKFSQLPVLSNLVEGIKSISPLLLIPFYIVVVLLLAKVYQMAFDYIVLKFKTMINRKIKES